MIRAALFGVFITVAAAAPGQTNLSAVAASGLLTVQNDLITAAADYQASLPGAAAALSDATNATQSIIAALESPSVQTNLNRRLVPLRRALNSATSKIEAALGEVNAADPAGMSYQQKQKAIGRIKTAASSVGTLAGLARKLLLPDGALAAFGNPAGCNMYRPGQLVSMRLELPAGCEAPAVSLVNNTGAGDAEVVNTASLSGPSPKGLFTFRMGEYSGSATIQVTACGLSSTTLIYNFGKPPPNSLPAGFPHPLPRGKYVLSWSKTIVSKQYDSAAGVWQEVPASVPPTVTGYLVMSDIQTFAATITRTITLALGPGSQSGCLPSFSFSSFTDNVFTASCTLNCPDADPTESATGSFTLTKQ